MPRADLTDITVVLDRSGSMLSCRNDAEGGLNAFVESQKQLSGEAVYTLVQFDNVYEFVHRGIPIKSVPQFKLVPRGSTALLDAVGKAIVETGERLSAMKEDDRPGLVVFVIVTDGEENSSVEYKRDKIKQMIETQTNVYKWQFTYLGANQDAFAVANSMGIASSASASYSTSNSSEAFSSASRNTSRMRGATLSGQSVSNRYTDEERASLVK